VQRAQAAHVLPSELGTQPLRARSRKQLDKCRDSLPCSTAKRIVHCHTTIFAAIGPDSATELGGCPAPAPLSVIHIHGTADKNIPYQGGEGDGVAHIDGPSVPSLNARWRGIDHCAAPATKTAGAVTTSTAACPGGRTVELITIAGAGHQWPGAVPPTRWPSASWAPTRRPRP